MSKTGGSNDYYALEVRNTLDGREAFTVQCLEIIETLGMTFAEGEAFKAIWRSCAARTLGKQKPDNNALYDAEKVEFYGRRMVQAVRPQGPELPALPEGFIPYRNGQATPAPMVGMRVELIDVGGYRFEPKSYSDVNWATIKAYRVSRVR